MAQNPQIYPISSQPFQDIRERGLVYIDKTALVYEMTHSGTDYVFLSRPRRFGKALLVSTLGSYFGGREELFEGLAIDKLEREWKECPVLHFDMSTAKYGTKEGLESELNIKLREYEKLYGREEGDDSLNQRLTGLIRRACEQTGQPAP